jgi:predicted NACHT family NTPase
MYNWKRFWCPITGKLKFDHLGFLADPEDYGYITNPDVVPFTDISHIPCLVLLGEAGIGKTTAAKQEYTQRLEQVRDSDDECLWFELGEYETDTRLCQKIFENQTVQTWRKGSNKLYLFLDSLDEGLLSIKILVRILKREIENLPCERLYLRITCRTADWSDSLEQKLKQKWGEENVGIYQLAPLRRSDVIEAAKQQNINSDEFIQEVIQREAVPLAIKPITLKFLLSIYQKNKQFPDSQKELYKQGCLKLCQEVNPDRFEAGFTGQLDENQRLIVAGRIAALTILANRAAIWTSPETEDMPDSDIAIGDLCGGQENINQQKFDIDKVCIQDVLSVTGLFSGRGTNRIGFAHQTYAEFLAAWYLVERNIPLVQVMSLIVSSDDSEHKLVPQLHETAAWLASMRDDIFQEIIRTDPDVILRSDIATDASKKAIIDNLLKQYDQENLFPSLDNSTRYKKLKHPGVAEQLRPYIQDYSKQFYARHEAIKIAEICDISELQEDLVNLALDSSQHIQLRAKAAKAICSIGDADTRLKLKPLAVGEIAEDENDELKGASLMAVWSEYLTAEELFRDITPPKNRNFPGNYHEFLQSELVQKLQSTDLLIALDWVEKQGARLGGHPFEFEELANSILLKAWDNFDSPGVAESFAKIALIQWQRYQPVITSNSCDKFLSLLLNEDDKRRKLIEQVVRLLAESEDEPLDLLNSATHSLCLDKDILWMFDKLQQSTSESTQKTWAKFIKPICRIFISSPDNLKYVQEIDAIITEKEILLLLEQLESGKLDAWWQLNWEMTPQAYRYKFESDVTKFPGWKEADSDTRRRIIEGANKYIHEQNEVAYDWIGTNNDNRAAFAGCRALQLLLKESPDCLDTFYSEIWQRWTPVIMAFPASNQNYLELVKLSYSNAPDEAIDTLFLLIDKKREGYNYPYITQKLKKCWDERLKSACFQKAKDKALNPKWMGKLLDELLHHDFNEAKEFAQSLITFPLPPHPEERERTIVAAIVLLENAEPNSWSKVWSVIQQDPNFGREIFELETYSSSNGINLNMTEEQMADLYIWLIQQYPENEQYSDPK